MKNTNELTAALAHCLEALEKNEMSFQECLDKYPQHRELDPQLQDVFICRFINKLSHAETARTLGLKEGHVRVLQYRALKKIRITLE